MTELSRLGYERVRGQLIDVAKEYFAYLKVDKTLPTDEISVKICEKDLFTFLTAIILWIFFSPLMPSPSRDIIITSVPIFLNEPINLSE